MFRQNLRQQYASWYRTLSLGLPLAISALIFALGALVTFIQAPLFESQALLWVQPKQPVQESEALAYSPLNYSSANPFKTVCELFKSDAVITGALHSLNLKLPPSERPNSIQLLTGLQVSPVRESDIVLVRYRSGKPETAKIVLEELIASFLSLHHSQMASSATVPRKVLENQLALAQKQDLAARKNLKQFQDENDAVNLQEQVAGLIRQENFNASQIEDTKLNIAAQQAKLDSLRSKVHFTQAELDAAQRLSQDDTIKMLRQLIAEKEVNLLEMASRVRPDHPRAKRAKKALEKTKAALIERANAIAGEYGAAVVQNQLPMDDPVQRRLIDAISDAETELVALENKLSKLASVASEIRSKLKDVPALQEKQAELNRAVESGSREVSAAESRYNMAKSAEIMTTSTSTIRIVDSPSLPTSPVSPNVPLNLAASLLVGLSLGGATFFVLHVKNNPFVRNAAEISKILPFPVLGWDSAAPGQLRLTDMVASMQQLRRSWRALSSGEQRKIVVTSTDPNNGTTAAAAGLALSFAQSGSRVVLIDCNGDNPGAHKLFNSPSSPGLGDFLASANPGILPKIMRQVKPNLQLIPAGDVSSSQSGLETEVLITLFDQLRSQADVVILDTPALSQSSDALALLSSDTHLLLVMQLNDSLKDSLLLAGAQLQAQQMNSGAIFLFEADARSVATGLSKPELKTPAAETGLWQM